MARPTPEQLRGMLRYEPETGELFWLSRAPDTFATARASQRWNAIFPGLRAFNTKNSHGYLCGRVFGKNAIAHRVIWAVHYGEWPTNQIDHINGVRSDNRLLNLREATNQENAFNRGAPRNNTSGFKGVSWDPSKNRWRADIYLNGKRICLGRFTKAEAAAEAYSVACSNHYGKFGRSA